MALSSLVPINEKIIPFPKTGSRVGNPGWFTKFPNSTLWHLPRITSNHLPLLLNLVKMPQRLGAKPFRFEPMWLLEPTFYGFVEDERRKSTMEGSLIENLSVLYQSLSHWNKVTFNNIHHRKKQTISRLQGTQIYFSFPART